MILSSSATISLKIFLPIFWLTFFGAFTAALWFTEELSGLPLAQKLRIAVLVFTLIGLVVFLLTTIRLKRVEWREQAFHVTNYMRHVRIPLELVSSIQETDLIICKLLTLHLDRKGHFGKKIHFIARAGKIQRFLNEEPEVVHYFTKRRKHSDNGTEQKA